MGYKALLERFEWLKRNALILASFSHQDHSWELKGK